MRRITEQNRNLLPQKMICSTEMLSLRRRFLIVMGFMLVIAAAWRSPQAVTIILDDKPLLIDSEDGRLYTTGLVGDKPQTLVLSAEDGRLVKTYDISGPLGLDPVHNWLYTCNDQGLAVLEAQTGHLYKTIPLPQAGCSALEADPTTSRVLAVHDNLVYEADIQTGAVLRSIPFDVPFNSCGTPTEELTPINGTAFDSAHQLLYLRFASFSCIPWHGETMLAFDLVMGQEIERKGGSFPTMTAFDGYLYSTDWHRFGIGYRSAWQPGRSWFQSDDWSGGYSSNLQVDSKRHRLYDLVEDGNLRVFDAPSMTLLKAVPQLAAGKLVGYDPQTDQLYFRTDEGQLQLWPAAAIEPLPIQALPAAHPPLRPANFLAVSPQWPEDKTLVGLWDYKFSTGGCYGFGQSGGEFYLSSDGGNTWSRPDRGLPHNCGISTMAISPQYAEDQTILIGVNGWGLFRSTNGGQSWTPSSKGLTSMGINQILLSPGFVRDGVAFTKTRSQTLYRSNDRGQTWQELLEFVSRAAISPEFEQDQALMTTHTDYYSNTLQSTVSLSHDGGYHWQQVGPRLDGDIISLNMAPLFDQWHVVFAFNDKGRLYRSGDGGLTWDIVLDTSQATYTYYGSAQLVFAPNIEVNRPVFLVVTTIDYDTDPPTVGGTLYRSGDGGLTWQEAGEATSVAISPAYAQDGLLFSGLADGQLKTWQP